MHVAGRIETTSTHTNFRYEISLRRGGLDTSFVSATLRSGLLDHQSIIERKI